MKMDKTYACVPSLKVAFVGLGVMGFPMAGHLKLAGHDVCVYNRTTTKAEKWVETFGGRMAATPAEAARGAGIVFACVGNDDDLRSVVLGETGAFAGMEPGTVFVDHTTATLPWHASLRPKERGGKLPSSTHRSPVVRRALKTGA